MYILSFFTNEGTPATGLTPTIRIRLLPHGTLLVEDEEMTELGDGFYFYNFTDYSYSKDYAIRCDGTDALNENDRYVICGNENYREDISNVMNENISVKKLLGLMHENIYIDQTVYDNDSNLISARIRIYANASDVGTDNNVIGEYRSITVPDGPGKFTNWSQIKS